MSGEAVYAHGLLKGGVDVRVAIASLTMITKALLNEAG